jgi:tRNA A-37 threonylcarbamoyl transferase component Bud32
MAMVVSPSAGARDSRAVSFRLAPEGAVPLRTATELEHQLRRRLRLISALIGTAVGALGLFALVVRWEHVSNNVTSAFAEPPLPGVLIVVSLGMIGMFVALSPATTPSIRRLRIFESFGVFLLALFLLLNQMASLPTMGAMLLDKPMEVGIAQGAPWAALIVAYGVLIPGSLRRVVIRTAAIAVVAFIPDLVRQTGSGLGPTATSSYFALKAFIIGVMSALGIYGSYRIEELGQQVEVARELGQYLLRRSLGEGGMGQVFLAEHRFLRRPCAVKLIRADQASSEMALARFEREVQSTALLTHPNTVHIYDYGRSDDGTFYFAMEFLPGISLADLVEKHGPLEPGRAVHGLTQLCGALQEAHNRGLVHRDLKPGNVMLCERGGVHDVAKLLDFGLVAEVSPDIADEKITQAGVMMGTPAYMSPEQCAGDEAITPASDIYALGALGYFLLNGSPPFTGRSAMMTIVAHLGEKPPRLDALRPGVPAALADVLLRCLEKKPADRYPTVTNLGVALLASIGPIQWSSANARDWWSNRSIS